MAKAKLSVETDKKLYNCKFTVKHNGTVYEANEAIELTDDEARSLLETSTITLSEVARVLEQKAE